MKKRTLIVAVGSLVTVPVIAFLAIGLRHDPNVIESPLIGKPAPAFSLKDLDGNEVSLEELKGTPVLMNFWATWCVPCMAEHESFREATRRLGDRVRFVGVIYQDEVSLIRRFQAGRGSWGPTLIDPASKVAIAYGVYGVPESYLIDGEGVIVDKIASPLMTANHVFGWLDKHGLLGS